MKNLMKTLLLTISLSITLFANDVATVTGVNGEATIQRNGTEIKIALGVVLKEEDTVKTNKNAKVQIIFKDETVVTIGKNSHFSINEYLFDDTAEPIAKFSMFKGAMRTITGKIGKIAPEKFKVTAKTATIGIRGTNFTINITEDNMTEVYCTFGAISITIDNNEHIVEQGSFIVVSPDGKTNIRAFEPKDLKKTKSNFTGSTTQKSTTDEELVENAPIDNTTENFENITIKDISNSSLDADFFKKETESIAKKETESIAKKDDISKDEDFESDLGLSNLLAGYSMDKAKYTGSYTVTNDQIDTDLGSSGDAILKIDFGNDKIDLVLNNVLFQSNPSFNDTGFSVDQTSHGYGDERGTANGIFQGETGQEVTGDFNFYHESETKGTFDVSTEQELH